MFGQLAADQVTVVGPGGEAVDGALQPTSELDLHLGDYRRYRAGAPVARSRRHLRLAPYATFGTPEVADSVLTALDGRSAGLPAGPGVDRHRET
ncbi:hypothetical protein ABZ357_12130 [Streptomyces sp. NPDC005917]|uniref:hypothetical protein n=1 Tax=unclassified Streptomyces TaxID=2593676 RepID=UPI0033E328C6